MEPQKKTFLSGYDLIGDVNGHADQLLELLCMLGYLPNEKGVFSHPGGRKAIFVGDLIDDGPQVRETLNIVRPMVDEIQAYCVMGNHEYNAINFWERAEPDGYRRKHTIRNIVSHSATIQSFLHYETEWEDYLQWFSQLPLYLDFPELRVVHACWDPDLPVNTQRLVDFLAPELRNPTQAVLEAIRLDEVNSAANDCWNLAGPVENALIGPSLDFPKGFNFISKDGSKRTRARIKWWINPKGLSYADYLEKSAAGISGLNKIKVTQKKWAGYPPEDKPVFFGHYLFSGSPTIQATNVCGLNYGISKGGNLMAYRFDGEQVLNESKFVSVK